MLPTHPYLLPAGKFVKSLQRSILCLFWIALLQAAWAGVPGISEARVASVDRATVSLTATVDSGGLSTTWHFEYGLSTAYGSSTPSESIAAGDTGSPYATVADLTAGRRYHWRLVAQNAAGTAASPDGTFVTPACSGNAQGVFALVDIDRDGDLDLIQPGFVPVLPEDPAGIDARLQINDGAGHFSPALGPLPALDTAAQSLAVTDIDRDGDADVLLIGAPMPTEPSFVLLKGDAGGFVKTTPGLPDLQAPCAAWGDYDNDGDDDLLIAGSLPGGFNEFTAQLWRNDDGTLSKVATTGSPLVGLRDGVARWVDTDGDGDLDLVMTGRASLPPDNFPAPLSLHYRNEGGGHFAEVQREFFTLDVRSLAFADFDADGDPDVVGGGEPMLEDPFQTGFKGGILRNQGGLFELPAFLSVGSQQGEGWGAVAWLDLDNDGRIDLAEVPSTMGFLPEELRYVQRWPGIAGGFGAAVAMPELAGPGTQLAWGDLNGDASADLVLAQSNAASNTIFVWPNEPPVGNVRPAAPANIGASVGTGRIDFQWPAATDDRTPAAALTYNLRVGTAAGLGDILSPLARPDGRRFVTGPGNVGLGTTAWLRARPGTVLHFAVQAVDTAGAASAFSTEGTLTVPFSKPAVEWLTPSQVGSTSIGLRGNVFPNGQATTWYFEYGPTAAYGQRTATLNAGDGLDPVSAERAISALVPETLYHFRLVATNATGTSATTDVTLETPALALFTALTGASDFADTLLKKAEWVDVDWDQRMDLVAIGRDSMMGEAVYLFHNAPTQDPMGGQTIFRRSRTATGPFSAFALGNVNRDSSVDIALIGAGDGFMSGPSTDFYTALSEMSFGFELSWPIGQGPLGVANGTVAFPDVLNRGERALFLSGDTAGPDQSASGLPLPATRLYRIVKTDGPFSSLSLQRMQGLAFPSLTACGCAWGDYDADGDNDVLLFGSPAADGYASAPPLTQLWRNDGDGVFSQVVTTFPGLTDGEAVWVDFDVDGLLDLSLCGYLASGQPYTAVWRNAGSGFVALSASLTAVGSGSLSWADFDGDGDPDLALCGNAAASGLPTIQPLTRLYRNDRTAFTATSPGFPDVVGVVRWGDADADGRPDLLVAGDAGTSGSGTVSTAAVWKNDMPATNTAPSPPGNLRAAVENGRLVFRWNAAFDPETPSDALTYALRIGTASGDSDLMSAEAGPSQYIGMNPPDPLDGRRHLMGPGNSGAGTSAWLAADTVEPGQTLYWTVQAVDSAGAGSRFAAEKSFTVPALPPVVQGLPPAGHAAGSVIFRGNVDPRGAATTVRFDYGLSPAYGSSTALSVVAADADAASQSVSHAATGLPIGVPIHYRLVGTNSAGQAATADGVLILPGHANDLLADRGILAGSAVRTGSSLSNATMESGENSTGTGHSVWWQWTAPQRGPVRISCVGSTGPTVLNIYRRELPVETPAAPLTFDQLTLNNASTWHFDPIGGQGIDPQVTLFVEGGETYFIQMDVAENASLPAVAPAAALTIDQLTLQPELTPEGRFALTIAGPPGASVELLRTTDLIALPPLDGNETLLLDSTGKCRILGDSPRATGREFIKAGLANTFP